MKFMIGADPEIFLRDAAEMLVASCGKIGGTKQAPMPLDLGDGFAVLEDNVALEYNVPPSESKEQFVNTINRAMNYLSDMVNRQGLHFSKESAASFPVWELMHPAAREFGCDPDYSAWENGKRNQPPRSADPTLRSCGGHIHVGYKFKSQKDVIKFIKYMDLFTIGSIIMDEGDLRRNLYGKAGAFRYKPYGCEYRSLSNFWVHEPKYTEWVWDATDRAVTAYESNMFDIDSMQGVILEAINNNNKQLAQELVIAHQLPMA